MSTSQRAVMPCGWGVKAGMVRVWVAGKTVWSPCYTHEPYLSALEIGHYKALYEFTFFTLLLHLLREVVSRWDDDAFALRCVLWLCRGRINGGGCDINALGLLPDKLKTELALHVNLETLKKVHLLKRDVIGKKGGTTTPPADYSHDIAIGYTVYK